MTGHWPMEFAGVESPLADMAPDICHVDWSDLEDPTEDCKAEPQDKGSPAKCGNGE